jgi:threonine-phosphate decarboxylase
MHNIPYEYFIARESQGFKAEINLIKKQVKGSDTVFICNPNNPTGAFYTAAEMESLCSALPDTYFVIDESYLPFVSFGDHQSMISSSLPNVIILNSILMLIEKLSNLSLQ